MSLSLTPEQLIHEARDRLEDLLSVLATVQSENAGLKKVAERYQFIRKYARDVRSDKSELDTGTEFEFGRYIGLIGHDFSVDEFMKEFDGSIDSAMEFHVR